VAQAQDVADEEDTLDLETIELINLVRPPSSRLSQYQLLCSNISS